MWLFGILLILFSMGEINGINRTYMLFISEDVSIGHKQIIDIFEQTFCLVYSVRPLHRDSPFEVTLTLHGNCTLDLHVNHLLDREQKSMYTIEQELIDKTRSITMIIQLSILILDVNDHIPQFESEHFQFQVKEDLQPGTIIGRVQAYDPDILLNGRIYYTLVGNNQTMFRIDKDTGEIFLSDFILDYETKREYNMMVEARDYGNIETILWPSVSSYADITIRIEDINDEKPEIILTIPEDEQPVKMMSILKPQLDKEQTLLIDSFHSSINLIENDADLIHLTKEEPLPINTLLALLHLRDKDQISNGFLSLKLRTYVQCSNKTVSIENNLFHLSIFRSNVYGLFTSRILDREEYENYIIHLIVDDNDHTNTSKSFQSELFIYFMLLDINDNSPIFDQVYYHVKIDENQPKKNALTRVYAYDIDKGQNGTVHYELMVKNNQIFTLDKYTGVLRAKHKLDREECELYRIGIRAYDLGFPESKYSTIILVDIEINNLNDHIPYFIHDRYHFEIMENLPIGKIIGRVIIDDRDEQEPIEQMINLSTIDEEFNLTKSKKISRVNYSTIDFLFVDSQQNESLSGLFSIDSQGFIHTLAQFDRELQSNYSLYVSMYDSMLKSYSLPTRILVEILDENDNPPYEPFLSNSSILSIEQLDNQETIIYEFHLIDHDDGLNGFVSIECLNCTSIFYFSIENSSILKIQSNITIPNGLYTLAFIVRDHGLIISHKRLYTLTFNLTHRSNSKQEKALTWNKFSWHYFSISWFIIFLIILSAFYCYHQSKKSDSQDKRFHYNNLNSIAIENHSTHRSRIISQQLHNTSSHHLSVMNSRETMLTNAAINTTSYQEDKNEIWQPMNTQVFYENITAYQFQPINQNCPTNPAPSQINKAHSIQRPIPISNSEANGNLEHPKKRNSIVNIDSTVRSYGIPRSITSDHLTNHPPNRLYYYPSVQDVLDALNRRSFVKESFV